MAQNLVCQLALVAAFALAPSLIDPSAVQAQERPKQPLKVAFVYVTPVGQAGWTYQADLGRQAMERALGARVQTTVVESVAEGPDA
jgi:basic membrane protein A and related proteins